MNEVKNMSITIEDIKTRLETFGYKFNEASDTYALNFAKDKAEQHIKNVINSSEIPEESKFATIDAICAEFLALKNGTGQLPDELIESVVKSVKMGDATITLDESASVGQQFDAIVSSMTNYYSDDFMRFRKMVW